MSESLPVRVRYLKWTIIVTPQVYIAGRSEDRVAAAIKQLESEGIEDGSLHLLKVNLAIPKSVKRSSEEFLATETRLDILGE